MRRATDSHRVRHASALAVGVVAALAASTSGAGVRAASSFVNWAGYLHGPQHSSDAPAATAITPSNAGALRRSWHWTPDAPTLTGQPSAVLEASPTVVNGVVYIGAETGVMYALNETTGAVIWKRLLGFSTSPHCSALGVTSTATVAANPKSGQLTVYVTYGNGTLAALDAATGSAVWQTLVTPTASGPYYMWSSPTVSGGHIYVGLASRCDRPLVRGGLREYDQATGALVASYFVVPSGSVGGSIWSSALVTSDGHLLTTTGNESSSTQIGDSLSVVELGSASLTRQQAWRAPAADIAHDADFGGSATLFTATLNGVATPMVGACSKDGHYYALREAALGAGPLWNLTVGLPAWQTIGESMCIAAAAWDPVASTLYVAGNATTIGIASYPGSIRRVDPATGNPLWATGLSGGPALGSPSVNGGGVVAVGTRGTTGSVFLVNAADGVILANLLVGGGTFSQPVFADGALFVASEIGGLTAFAP